jgi:hypothetical protein
MPWTRKFDDPVPGIVTLRDAASYILKLPKAEQIQAALAGRGRGRDHGGGRAGSPAARPNRHAAGVELRQAEPHD